MEERSESLIKFIDVAIGEKTRYTDGDCQRVPDLSMQLAEAVNDDIKYPLAVFELTDRGAPIRRP